MSKTSLQTEEAFTVEGYEHTHKHTHTHIHTHTHTHEEHSAYDKKNKYIK